MPLDPAATLGALGACRRAMLDVLRVVRPMGPAYHAASMVVSAIDGFATFLTGERYFFSAGPTAPSDPRRQDRAEARSADGGPPPDD